MKELLKRIKREIEQELLKIRKELKNIDKKTNEHDFYLLKNREGFLVFDLKTLSKGINEKSIETILRYLRIEDEEDIFEIGCIITEEGVKEYKKENYALAIKLYQKAWYKFRVSEALFNLGCMYFEGKGIKRDHTKTLELWEIGAKHNCQQAQFNLAIFNFGLQNLEIDNPEIDFDKGLEFLKSSASQGYEKAIKLLEAIEEGN